MNCDINTRCTLRRLTNLATEASGVCVWKLRIRLTARKRVSDISRRKAKVIADRQLPI
jgi:hypothetical protein